MKKYCDINKTTFSEADYNAVVKDIRWDNVKDKSAKIKKICGVTKSIDRDGFGLDLAKVISPDMEVFKQMESDIFVREEISGN